MSGLAFDQLQRFCFPYGPEGRGYPPHPLALTWEGRPATFASNGALAALVEAEAPGPRLAPASGFEREIASEVGWLMTFMMPWKAEALPLLALRALLGAPLELEACPCAPASRPRCASCRGSGWAPLEVDPTARRVAIHGVDLCAPLAAAALSPIASREVVSVGRAKQLQGSSLLIVGRGWRVMVAGLTSTINSVELADAGRCPSGRDWPPRKAWS